MKKLSWVIKFFLQIDYIKALKQFALHNSLIKLVAIVTALIIYIYVGLENKVEKVIRVPLLLENQPRGYVISGDFPPRYLTVWLYGSKGGMAKVDENEISARINLKKASKRVRTYSPVVYYDFPRSVKVERMSPDKVEIKFSKRSKKIVEVEPTFINEPKEDVEVVVYKIKPKKINVYGPENILKDIINIYTEPIDLKDVTENTEFEVKISKNTSPWLEFNREKNFRVTVNIETIYTNRKITNFMLVEVKELVPELAIDKKSILTVRDIAINISIDHLDDFDENNDIYFYVNLSKIKTPGIYEIEVNTRLSDYVEIIGFSPKNLKINILEKTASELTNQIKE